jgi:hypothetical protein
MPETIPTRPDPVEPQTLEELFHQACSWGAVYGEAISPENWDQCRKAKVAKLMESAAAIFPRDLSTACKQVLQGNDAMTAQESLADSVAIFDCDGYHLFNVTTAINEHDLGAMFRLHARRYEEGTRAGREGAFAGLRAYIGVDEAIAQATAGRES